MIGQIPNNKLYILCCDSWSIDVLNWYKHLAPTSKACDRQVSIKFLHFWNGFTNTSCLFKLKKLHTTEEAALQAQLVALQNQLKILKNLGFTWNFTFPSGTKFWCDQVFSREKILIKIHIGRISLVSERIIYYKKLSISVSFIWTLEKLKEFFFSHGYPL